MNKISSKYIGCIILIIVFSCTTLEEGEVAEEDLKRCKNIGGKNKEIKFTTKEYELIKNNYYKVAETDDEKLVERWIKQDIEEAKVIFTVNVIKKKGAIREGGGWRVYTYWKVLPIRFIKGKTQSPCDLNEIGGCLGDECLSVENHGDSFDTGFKYLVFLYKWKDFFVNTRILLDVFACTKNLNEGEVAECHLESQRFCDLINGTFYDKKDCESIGYSKDCFGYWINSEQDCYVF